MPSHTPHRDQCLIVAKRRVFRELGGGRANPFDALLGGARAAPQEQIVQPLGPE
jgi:hypothetical protein